MKTTTFHDMTKEELQQKQRELREALFNLKFQHATGQLENTAQLKKTRRSIARITTALGVTGKGSAA
jgi:large subunit ribosomal protein L29